MRRRAFAFLLWWLVASASFADAGPRRPMLNWTRSEEARSCIDPRTLAERVEALTGPVFVAAGTADYAIEGHVEHARGQLVVRISVSDRAGQQSGERVLAYEGVDCRALDTAIAFVIAIMIDPNLDLDALPLPGAELEGQTPEQALLQDLEAHPPVPAALSPTPDPGSPARTGVSPNRPGSPQGGQRFVRHWTLSTAAIASFEELPQASLGASAEARWELLGRLGLAVRLRSLSTLRETELTPSAGVRADAFGAALALCTGGGGRLLSALVCAGAEPLWIRARGTGFDQERTGKLAIWGVLTRAELATQLTDRWTALLDGQLRVNLEHKRLVFTEALSTEPAYIFARYGGSFGIGLRYRFGAGTGRAGTPLASRGVSDGR